MVDKLSTVFVQNNVVYNLSSVALVSDTNEVVKFIQPEVQNNAIFLTAEQFQTLGLQVNDVSPALQIEEPNLIVNPTPLQVEKPNLIINQANNVNNAVKVKVQKLQSVLINNQNPVKINDANSISVAQKVPIYKQIIVKTPETQFPQVIKKSVQPIKKKKKIVKKKKITVVNSDNLQANVVNAEGQVVKPVDKVAKAIKTNTHSELFAKKTSINEKNNGKSDSLMQIEILDETAVTLKSVRTRSGRITKPPKHLKREKDTSVTNPDPTEPLPKQSCLSTEILPNLTNTITTESLLLPINNPNIKLEVDNNTNPKNLTETENNNSTNPLLALPLQPTQKRKIASTKYRCKTCQRFYLGRAKMKKHLQLNPDHKVPKKYESDNQLWLDLLERTYNAPKSDQIKVFVGELTNILEKVKNLVPKGLKPLVNENDPNSFKIDSTLSTLLGVSEGKYVLDMNVLKGTNPNVHQERVTIDLGILGSVNTMPMDSLIDDKSLIDSTESAVQTSLLNLLDTGQVHFDTESSNTSEAVRCVDQLVHERLEILTDIVELNSQTTSSLSPPNITLDLSMDMFPYTS